MSSGPGPREKALREMREARYAARTITALAPIRESLKRAIDKAAKKAGKPKKAKKK